MRKEWKLSSFDTFCLGMTIKSAWIYEISPDFERMKFALAQIADFYPHLAGRYDGKSKAVVWDDSETPALSFDSIELRQYECSQVTGDATLAWSLVPEYNIRSFKKGEAAPFRATLGYLKDGCILYVQCAHAVMDAQTFYALVNQWAGLYRGEVIFPMTLDQGLLPHGGSFSKEETIRRVQERGWLKMDLKRVVKMLWNTVRNNSIKETAVLEVSQEEISSLKNQSGAGTNAVLTALTLRKFAEKLPKREYFRLLFVADLRGRMKDIDGSFFGNLAQPVPINDCFQSSMDVAALASKIDLLLKDTLSSGGPEETIRLSQCSSFYGLPYFYFDVSDMNCPNPGTIYVNNLLKFRANELDWGIGLPQYVLPNDLNDMVKFWQPVAGGNIQLIFGGFAARIMK